jgi:hypothetical protein
MKKSLRTAGIVVLAAGVLSYPAYRLYQYIAKKRAEGKEDESEEAEEDHTPKHFNHTFRGKRKMQRRHAENGHMHHEA